MQMTISKKVVATLLALLMIFSSVSVLASAYTYNEGDDPITGTLTIAAKVFKSVDGEWVEATDGIGGCKVAPGDAVKVRVYVGTSYNTSSDTLMLYYDRDFFDITAASRASLTMNSANADVTANGITGKYSTNLINSTADEGSIRIALDSTNQNVYTLSASDWLFELDMTVLSTATTEGSVKAKVSDIEDGYVDFPYGDAGDLKGEVAGMYMWWDESSTANFTYNTVSVTNTVKFDAGYDEGTDAEVTDQIVGSTCTIPTITRDGYKLIGWTSNNAKVTAPAAADTTFTMPYEEDVTFTAVWEENVTIKFNTNGGTEIADITGSDVYGGAAWTNHPTTTRSGYKFMGWSGQDVVDGELPSTYPTAADGNNTFTYEASWEKYVTITFVSDGTTLATINADKTDETVYSNNAWADYDTYEAIITGTTRTGYALRGWAVNGDTTNVIKVLPTTYPADDTTYTAVWVAQSTPISYYFDETQSIVTDGTASVSVISSIASKKTTSGRDANKVDTDSADFGSTYTIPSLTVGDYTISTWYDQSGVAYNAGDTITISSTSPIVFTASKSETTSAATHAVIFDANGGEWADGAPATQYLAEGETIVAPATNPTKEGYAFAGWEPDVATMGNEAITFKAMWTAVEYVVSYDPDNGDATTDMSVAYGTVLSSETPAQPEKEGYTFLRWDYFDGTTPYTAATMPAKNITAVAQWTTEAYDILYKFDNGDADESKTLTVEEKISSNLPTEPTKEGYTFAGYVYKDADDNTVTVDADTMMPAKDLTATAQWTANPYTIVYKFDNSTADETKTLTVEEKISSNLPTEPIKEGYTFAGYVYKDADDNTVTVDADTMMPAKNLTATAQWTVNAYTLTFVLDNGEADVVYSEDNGNAVDYGTAIKALAPTGLTKTGFTFTGWSPALADDATMPASETTYTAQWSRNTYNLTLDYNYTGSTATVIPYAYEADIAAVENPTRTGYIFQGWDTDNDGTPDGIPAKMPADSVTAKAIWNTDNYTIEYNFNNGTANETKTLTVEEAINSKLPTEPTKEGYTFAGYVYKDSDDNTVSVDGTTMMPAKNLTATAQWTANPYTIVYKFDNDTADETKTFTVEDKISSDIPTEPTKTGYTFAGYVYKDADGNTVTVDADTMMPAKNMTATAQWTVNKYVITYTVDGEEYKKVKDVEYNSAVTLEADPTKTGYTFSGWNSSELVDGKMPAKDITISGTFTAIDYTLTYKVDGETYGATETYHYEDAITMRTAPTKEGYTFSGWSDTLTSMPASDVTITGTFTINDYDITYKVDGVVTKTVFDVEYNSAVTVDPEPTKEGYTFSGWTITPALVDGKMPAHDVTIEGTYTINSYDITYTVDGTEYKKVEDVEYNSAVTVDPEPTKEGYTFSGWTITPALVDGKMPAHDVTISGTFSINSYDITYTVDGAEYKKDEDVEYNSAVTLEAEPIKTGYTFSGWNSSELVDGKMPAKDITISGTFTANNYPVTFKMNDGTDNTYSSALAAYDSAITAPAGTPSREGYTFAGWSRNSAATAQDVPLGTVDQTSEITYYAVWTVGQSSYTVTTYTMGTDGSYDAGTTVTMYADTDTSVDATPTAGTGMYLDTTHAGYSATGKVTGDNSLALSIYIGRSQYDYTVDPDNGTDAATTTATYYGAAITTPTVTKTGYAFQGWDSDNDGAVNTDIPTAMPASALSIKAIWKINKYTVSYKVDGADYGTDDTYDYNAAVTMKAEPTKDGYTFSGWSETLTTMPATDVTITGTFTPITYTVTFDPANDDNTEDLDTVYDSASGLNKPATNPTLEGYTFDDWYIANDDGTPSDDKFDSMEDLLKADDANELTVVAKYTINSYDITYTVDGEELTKINNVEYNSAVTVMDPLTKEGYTFSGWTVTPALVDGKMPANNVTISGTFTANPYDAVFKMNDGTDDTYDTVSVAYDSAITAPATNPTRAGYNFIGWADAADGDELDSLGTMNSVTGKTFYAVWEARTDTIYKVTTYTMDAAGNYVAGAPETKTAETDTTVDATPTAGTGMYLDTTHEGYKATGKVTGDGALELTIYIGRSQYDYTVDPDNGTAATTTSTYYDAAITVPTVTKTGYTFLGWDTDNDGAVNVEVPTAMPASALTVKAIWQVNPYYITFDADGGKFTDGDTQKTVGANYGETFNAPADPTREGYKFTGWDSAIPETMPETNPTIKAIWSKESYNITFFTDGSAVAPATYEYDQTVTLPVSAKTGYDFNGWALTENGTAVDWTDGVPDLGEDGAAVTLYALFTPITYTVTFNANNGAWADGDTTKTAPTAFDSEITVPAENPARNGYSFLGWYTDAENGTEFNSDVLTTADNTVTYYAHWLASDDNVVKFNAKGGNWDGSTASITVTYDYDATITAPTDPVRDGYTFAGWSRTDGATTADASLGTVDSNLVNFYAVWTANEYTIKFYDNGTEYTSYAITAPYESEITGAMKPTDPTKVGYNFTGWNPTIPETMPLNGADLTAQWSPKNCVANFVVEGATTPVTVPYDASIDDYKIADPTTAKEGYIFVGWAATENGTVLTTLGTMDDEAGKTFYAVYTPDTAYAGFTFNANGGLFADSTDEAAVAQTYDSQIAVPSETPVREGYTIVGYSQNKDADPYTASEYVTAENLPTATTATKGTWYYIWQVNAYTVTYDAKEGAFADASTTKTASFNYNDVITAYAEAPTYYGYNFLGWYTADGTAIADTNVLVKGDVTVYAKYQAKSVKVVYNITMADGTTEIYDYFWTEFGTTITPEAYSAEGYGLKNNTWYTDAAQTTAFTSLTIDTEGVVNIYGTQEAKAYTVTFDPNSGKWADDTTAAVDVGFNYGETAVAPETPTRTGYTFIGWSPDLGEVTGDITYAAQWTPITYNLKFMADGAEVDTIDSAYGSDIDTPAAEKEGYTFENWYLDESFTTPLTWDAIVAAAGAGTDVNVYAKFTANACTITIDPANGDATYELARNYDDAVLDTDVVTPTRTGYAFRGWADADGNKVTAATKVTGDATYTAQWIVSDVPVKYVVNGVTVNGDSAEFGKDYTVLGYNDGTYNITEWTSSIDGATVAAGSKIAVNSTATITFTASTEDVKYTATFNANNGAWADGDAIKTVSAAEGEDIVAPADPTREGYTFIGWDNEVGTMGASDVTFTAQWKATEGITVTFKIRPLLNGAVNGADIDMGTDTYSVGETIDLPAVPDPDQYTELAGYEFVEWATIDADGNRTVVTDATVVTEDMTVYAVMNLGQYTVNYIVDGANVKSAAVTPGAALTAADMPEEPTKTYYTFAGWEAEDGTIYAEGSTVNSDLTLTAKFNRVPVKLVPASETSTAMIERNGVIESYNEGYTVNHNAYETPDNFETYYVYGLELGMTADKLANYVTVYGDGHYEVDTSLSNGGYGTGAVIKVIDNVTGDVVEQFYIVIFGDLNGDSRISATDSSIMDREGAAYEWSTARNLVAYRMKAADLNHDNRISATDSSNQDKAGSQNGTNINQITGTIS